MISTTSRYLTGRILHDPGSDTVMVLRHFPVPSASFIEHIWSDSDRLDLLASQYLGGAEFWWKILDTNPLWQNPHDIRPGSIVRIPR